MRLLFPFCFISHLLYSLLPFFLFSNSSLSCPFPFASVYPCQTFLCFLSSQLLKEINRTSVSRALRIRRQAGQSDPRAYVTAHFKTLPLEFTLGDGRNYGDFRNRPLQNGQEYVFFVMALLDLSENVSKNRNTHSHTVHPSENFI